MRAVIFAFLLTIALVPPGAAQDGDIQGVIGAQIDAFKADDFDRAFSFAAPGIQQIFRTPDNFRQMVTQGYPMVWRPAKVQFLDLTQRGAVQVQTVRIVDGAGREHILAYSMIQTGLGWRIAGVELLKAPGLNA